MRPRHRLAVFLLISLVGCNSGTKPPASKDGPEGGLEPVTLVLNWLPEAEHGGFYAALVHGYYKEAGLDVKILPGGVDSPVVVQVDRRSVDFGVLNADNLTFGRAQGATLVALMAPLQTSPRCLMLHASTGIETFDDLKDLTLAMNDSQAFVAWLKKKTPLEGVRIVKYTSSIAPFLNDPRYGQQAYVFSEPFLARKAGAEPRTLMLSDIGFNPYTSLLITSEALMREKPDVVRRMTQASVRGWEKYLESPDETNKYINSVNPEMDLDILQYGAEALKPLALGEPLGQPLGTMTLERWQTLVDQLIETKQIKPGSVDPQQLYRMDHLPAAPGL
jgi:NitT/TauT family transport system substrate-binding protein